MVQNAGHLGDDPAKPCRRRADPPRLSSAADRTATRDRHREVEAEELQPARGVWVSASELIRVLIMVDLPVRGPPTAIACPAAADRSTV